MARGDEAAAVDVLVGYRDRFAVGIGLGASAQQRALTLWYVLVPEARPHWDAADLGPYFAEARPGARHRRLAGWRAGTAAGGRRSPEPEVVRAFLPLPWAAELALAQASSEDRRAWTLLESLWPQGQEHVRRWADAPGSPYERSARTALARLPVPPTGRLELGLLGSVELAATVDPSSARVAPPPGPRPALAPRVAAPRLARAARRGPVARPRRRGPGPEPPRHADPPPPGARARAPRA